VSRRKSFRFFPILVAATLYYLIASSVLMVGQADKEERTKTFLRRVKQPAEAEAAHDEELIHTLEVIGD
jgi:hypothetical protein